MLMTRCLHRQFTFPLAARRIFRAPEKISPSSWAEKYRHVAMSSSAGKWSNARTPYLVGIMDAWAFSSVREVIAVAPPQTGKSEANLNTLGWAVDQDPGPAMLVMQTDADAKDMSRDRIRPMFEQSERLAECLSSAADDTATLRIALRHMPLYLGWGSSVSRLASKPLKYIWFDEEEKYPDVFTKETDPIRLGKKRVRTFVNHKIMRTCSPTVESGSIWRARLSAELRFVYQVRCPDCGHYHVMQFKQVHVPEGERDGKRILSKQLAWYECPQCGSCWDDARRDQAVSLGRWVDEQDGVDLAVALRAQRPTVISFHYSALVSSFVSLSEIMKVWFEAQGDRSALRDFFNGYLAEPWVEYRTEREVDRITVLRDDRPTGAIPSGCVVAGVVAAADTQKYGLWYEVRAFGFGLERESWQVRSGYIPYGGHGDENRLSLNPSVMFRPLLDVVFSEPVLDAKGNEYHVETLVIDSGGDYTAEVYDFARLHRGRVWAYKGEQSIRGKTHDFTQLDYYPASRGRKRPIPGGLRLLKSNTKYWKDKLSSCLEVSPHDPGAWHLNAECSDDWCEQLTAEYVDDKGNWVCPKHKDNHAWDCSHMTLLAAEVLRIPYRVPNSPKKQEIEEDPRPTRNGSRRRPGWFERRGR